MHPRNAIPLGRIINLIALVLALATASPARQAPDDQLFQQIFGKAQEKLGQAKTAQADILSPDVFARALKKYNEAKDDFKRGRSLTEINNKLREVNTDLDAAMNTAKLGKVALASGLQARDAALQSNAPQYAQEKYSLADKAFTDAARRVESGDMNSAKKKAEEAERLMREAELQSIKVSIIGPVHSQIQKAREVKVDRLAPATFTKAVNSLSEAENVLNTDRYAAGKAREKAEVAEYEIRHAVKLAEQIQRVKTDERQWEKYLLDNEQQIANISKELDFTAQFAEGIEKPVYDIRQAIKSLREERKSLTQEVTKLNGRMEEMNRDLSTIREAQAGVESLIEKQKRLEQERQRREERFKSVQDMFNAAEAKVFREGENLRVRLIGLTFQSGKSVILPQHFSLLTKLQRAIREFPNAGVQIEGHTDAVGDDGYNQRLSIARAEAVQQYLLANMNLTPDKTQAIGFGESAPIASNENEDGRTQNRRIDVVIEVPK